MNSDLFGLGIDPAVRFRPVVAPYGHYADVAHITPDLRDAIRDVPSRLGLTQVIVLQYQVEVSFGADSPEVAEAIAARYQLVLQLYNYSNVVPLALTAVVTLPVQPNFPAQQLLDVVQVQTDRTAFSQLFVFYDIYGVQYLLSVAV